VTAEAQWPASRTAVDAGADAMVDGGDGSID
jgi:hypothetical protein